MKNENCIFSFFKFWNMNSNFTFGFFEIRILISVWVSIKIETKLEFMEVDCDIKELLSDCQMFGMHYVWLYSMTLLWTMPFRQIRWIGLEKGRWQEGKERKEGTHSESFPENIIKVLRALNTPVNISLKKTPFTNWTHVASSVLSKVTVFP